MSVNGPNGNEWTTFNISNPLWIIILVGDAASIVVTLNTIVGVGNNSVIGNNSNDIVIVGNNSNDVVIVGINLNGSATYRVR